MSLNGNNTLRNVTNSTTIVSTVLRSQDILANTISEYTPGNGLAVRNNTSVTGNLTVSGTITGAVSGAITTTSMNCSDCNITGGTISGVTISDTSATLNSLNMNNNVISNVLSPTTGSDATNKTYVDNLISGLTLKSPVKVATTTTLPNAEALGTTILKGSIDGYIGDIDGIPVSADDRILVKNQTDQTQNGIYTFTRVGDGSSNWLLVRATDADNTPSNEVTGGMFCFVQQGTTNGDYGFVLTSPNGSAVLGTDNLVFTQFSAFTYTNGTGLNLTNRQFAVNFGSTSGTVCQGNDSRLSDDRRCNNFFEDPDTAVQNLSLGTIVYEDIPTAGIVTSNGTHITSQTMPSSGIVTSNGTTLSSQSMPTSGYVKSNGTTLSSVTTISSSDISGLGTMATATATDYCAKADNLSGLTNTTTARSNLGLGTMATQNGNSISVTGGSAIGLTSVSATNGTINNASLGTTSCTSLVVPNGSFNINSNTFTSGLLGLTTAGDWRTSLGLSSMATMDSSNVSFSGGTISNVTLSSPTFSGLSVRSPQFMQIGVGSAVGSTGYGGAWIHSSDASQMLIAGGGKYIDGSGWTATATQAHILDLTSGSMTFTINSGLTAGNTFTPTNRMVLNTTGLSVTGTLTVSGDLSYNNTGAGPYYPIGANHVNNMRFVSGRYNINNGTKTGDSALNTGFTVSASGGASTVTFVNTFTKVPHVVATAYWSSGSVGVIAKVVPNVTTSAVVINTINSGTGANIGHDGLMDIEVFFMAIGY